MYVFALIFSANLTFHYYFSHNYFVCIICDYLTCIGFFGFLYYFSCFEVEVNLLKLCKRIHADSILIVLI